MREEKREREVDRREGLAALPPCHSGEGEEALSLTPVHTRKDH